MSDDTTPPPANIIRSSIEIAIEGFRAESNGDRAGGKLIPEKLAWLSHFNQLIEDDNRAELLRLALLRCKPNESDVIRNLRRSFAPIVSREALRAAYEERVRQPDSASPDHLQTVGRAIAESIANRLKIRDGD